MKFSPTEGTKGFDCFCAPHEQVCKICRERVEAPAMACFSGKKGLLCKTCEPPIEFYEEIYGRRVPHLKSKDNANLPENIPVSTDKHNERFVCGCSHIDAADGQTSIVEQVTHQRINTINGEAVTHKWNRIAEYVEPKETIFKETDDEQGYEERAESDEFA